MQSSEDVTGFNKLPLQFPRKLLKSPQYSIQVEYIFHEMSSKSVKGNNVIIGISYDT